MADDREEPLRVPSTLSPVSASRRGVGALFVVVGMLASACAHRADSDPLARARSSATTSTTTTTRVPGTDGPAAAFVPDPIAWSRCRFGQCATVRVPLDYRAPTGRAIDLGVARVPATGARIGALFVNPGGPGATGRDFAATLATLLPRKITERFDIVGVDPRGVGASNPVRCGIDPAKLYGVDYTIDSPEDRTALLDVTKQYVDDCTIRAGDVLPFLGTRDVARDMDAVRAAMGDEQLSYLGFSYGTVIGQEYAALFPSHVRAMVLDGVVNLGPSGLRLATEQAAGFETALARFVAYCNGGSDCQASGNEMGTVEKVLALAEQPGGIPAPRAGRPAGPGEAALGIALALYSRSLWIRLDRALVGAQQGDGTALVALADQYIKGGGFEVYFAVNCLDFAWPAGDPDAVFAAAKQAGSASPHFGEALVNDYVRCADWPVPAAPLQPTAAPGTPPILVVSTTGDPATPYEGGVEVAKRLTKGVLVTNDGDGHTVVADGKPCVDRIVTEYLVDGTTPANGTTCR